MGVLCGPIRPVAPRTSEDCDSQSGRWKLKQRVQRVGKRERERDIYIYIHTSEVVCEL